MKLKNSFSLSRQRYASRFTRFALYEYLYLYFSVEHTAAIYLDLLHMDYGILF